MTGMRDREVKVTEVIPRREGLVVEQEVVKETSDDERESTKVSVDRFVAHWCGHYKPYGYSCFCGNRFCRSCQEGGRIWYCEECGVTIGSCCYRKRYDEKVLCPEHWKLLDWNHPALHVVWGAVFLGGLALGYYLLNLFVG